MSRGSWVSTMTTELAGQPGFRYRQGQRRDLSSLPPCPDRLWCPPSL